MVTDRDKAKQQLLQTPRDTDWTDPESAARHYAVMFAEQGPPRKEFKKRAQIWRRQILSDFGHIPELVSLVERVHPKALKITSVRNTIAHGTWVPALEGEPWTVTTWTDRKNEWGMWYRHPEWNTYSPGDILRFVEDAKQTTRDLWEMNRKLTNLFLGGPASRMPSP